MAPAWNLMESPQILKTLRSTRAPAVLACWEIPGSGSLASEPWQRDELYISTLKEKQHPAASEIFIWLYSHLWSLHIYTMHYIYIIHTYYIYIYIYIHTLYIYMCRHCQSLSTKIIFCWLWLLSMYGKNIFRPSPATEPPAGRICRRTDSLGHTAR